MPGGLQSRADEVRARSGCPHHRHAGSSTGIVGDCVCRTAMARLEGGLQLAEHSVRAIGGRAGVMASASRVPSHSAPAAAEVR